jgi:hypothetical protein
MVSKSEKIKYHSVLKKRMKDIYSTYNKVFCTTLNTYIYFNSIGFRHLIYKPDGTPRKINESIYKLTLVPLIIPTIKRATNIIDEREISMYYGRKKNSKIKKAKTYAITAVVGKNKAKVRVIILKIGNGNHIFYSIMKDKD